MMSRTQITLDPETHERAREKARQLGLSLAEYVRRALAADLGELQIRTDVAAVFDLGSSVSDIAADKDRLVGEAIAALHQGD